MGREHHVKIGELRRGRHGEILRTTLGSCVGIALLWPSEQRFALAHCLLGEAPADANHTGAKYVSLALPNLLRLLRARANDCSALEVVVAGGASMMENLAPRVAVGAANIRAAETGLKNLGLQKITWDVGGDRATEVVLDCSTGAVQVRRLKKYGSNEYAAS